eukprot:446369-Pyramimonas_sp.AAC.1
MRFIRAVEISSVSAIGRCISSYPYLADLVPNPYCTSLREGGALAAVREHAVALARDQAVRELT